MRTREATTPKPPSAFSRRKADTERLEAQLAEWTSVIAQYRANALRGAVGCRPELDRLADELQLLRNEAGIQYLLLKDSSDLAWGTSVADLDQSWDCIRPSFLKAAARVGEGL